VFGDKMGHLKLNLKPSYYMEDKNQFSLVQITETQGDVTNL